MPVYKWPTGDKDLQELRRCLAITARSLLVDGGCTYSIFYSIFFPFFFLL
jgi:hypothetical protein